MLSIHLSLKFKKKNRKYSSGCTFFCLIHCRCRFNWNIEPFRSISLLRAKIKSKAKQSNRQMLKYETTFPLQNTRPFDVLSLSVHTNTNVWIAECVIVFNKWCNNISAWTHFLFIQFSRLFLSTNAKTHFLQAAKTKPEVFCLEKHTLFHSIFPTGSEAVFQANVLSWTRSQRIANAQIRWFSSNLGEFGFSNIWQIMAKSFLAPIGNKHYVWSYAICGSF